MYPSQQNATDQTSNFFWLIAIIAGVLLAIWFFARQWFVVPVYYVRYWELSFFYYLVGLWNQVVAALPMLHLHYANPIEILKLKHDVMSADPHTVDWADFASLNTKIGGWARFGLCPILLILSALSYFKFGNHKFTKIYSMQSLRDIEQQNWPEIRPVLSLDLVKEDIEIGPWAMAKTPLNFCKENNLVTPTEKNERHVWKLDCGAAHKLLTMQLGPVWTNAADLPIHIQALVIIFIARAERERDVANNLLAQIARSAGGGKLDFSGVSDLMKSKYAHSRIIQWLEQRHAYVYTLLASLLEIARSDGVLATAEFLWLKPVDRRLWYVLNSVGRQTAVVEIAGAHAHWLTEKKVGRSLRTPMVVEAVKALEANMLDTLYVHKGDSWHTFNAA